MRMFSCWFDLFLHLVEREGKGKAARESALSVSYLPPSFLLHVHPHTLKKDSIKDFISLSFHLNCHGCAVVDDGIGSEGRRRPSVDHQSESVTVESPSESCFLLVTEFSLKVG